MRPAAGRRAGRNAPKRKFNEGLKWIVVY